MYYLGLNTLDFTAAKFDDCENGLEKYIISSTGKYSIIWQLRSIINGRVDDYKVKKLDDEVVMIEFKFNYHDNVYAALPNSLCLQSTKPNKNKRVQFK